MTTPTAPPAHSEDAARAAHLRYVTDAKPGIRREKNEDGTFRYFTPNGDEITDAKTLARIKAIALPPAYTDVWICPYSNGHMQATGRDAKGRKQYRYHERWRSVRDETKYDRMLQFGDALPGIRARVSHDLGQKGLPRTKVLAAVVRLMEETRIRVGNHEYARNNHHYGLTTLHHDHVEVDGSEIHFHFVGKAGKKHEIAVRDKRVARVVQKCQDLPGQELFQWKNPDDGLFHDVDSGDVNEYLRDISGQEFTAKDFRTWAGTVLCALTLSAFETVGSDREAKHNVVEAIRTVAQRLGNTPSVCRKCYIHPTVLSSYLDGSMTNALNDALQVKPEEGEELLSLEEAAVLGFLRRTASAA